MLRTISVVAAILISSIFSAGVIFGNPMMYQLVMPFYFAMITPMLVLFEKVLTYQESESKDQSKHFPLGFLFFCIPVIASIVLVVDPEIFKISPENDFLFCTTYISTIILAAHITAQVFALYLLENMYRYALLYQRRIGWVSFIGFLVLVCHQLFFSTRWLLYGWIPVSWIRFAAFLYIPIICAIPWSFIKYRVAKERIKVTRDAVYSSFSLLIVGALFTAVGITVTILRSFKIDLSPFDFKVLGMSVLFAGTILAGSARMRRRVAKLVNRRFYSNRYDYRFQFFSLHRILGRVEGYDETIEETLEHLRRSLNADHAYLFIANEHSGNYELLSPKESHLPDSLVIRNNSPIIETLNNKGDYFGILRVKDNISMHIDTDNSDNLAKLQITDVAPVLHYDSLLAILALRSTSSFDTEDTALVEAYTSVIADFLFKHRILKERLEQKQFESFSHMASFIVHDVKNQVATLKLLLKNAEQNIANPRFQESLLVSLGSCTSNLGNLVSKLSMPPRRDRLKVTKTEIAALIHKLIDETGLNSLPAVQFEKRVEPDLFAEIDESALYYTVKNLIVNALESMEGKGGKLTITVSSVRSSLLQLTTRFLQNEAYFSHYSVLISVEDTGSGMSIDFIRNRLFKPFSTTKDKGIGIGLYQCKTLIEQMGGKILCESEVGRGTLFCILL